MVSNHSGKESLYAHHEMQTVVTYLTVTVIYKCLKPPTVLFWSARRSLTICPNRYPPLSSQITYLLWLSLRRAMVAAQLQLCTPWAVVSVSRKWSLVGGAGGPTAPLPTKNIRWPCCDSLRWGSRAKNDWGRRGWCLMGTSPKGWTRSHKPWVISRLQKGRRVTLSKPNSWRFCTFICPGRNADFKSPFLTSVVEYGSCWIDSTGGMVLRGGVLQDIFLTRFDLETQVWKLAWGS